MRNIPDFDCEYGAAQLILEEVQRNGKAYCLVLWAVEGQVIQLLQECRRFCRMVGAEQIFGLLPENLPVPEGMVPGFEVLEMQAEQQVLAGGAGCLWPMTEETAGEFLQRYNGAMKFVDGARRLREKEMPALAEEGGCYFVHRQGELLGLGQVRGNEILSVVGCQPGAGETVVRALASVIGGDVVQLSVASTNGRARKLYERLGFVITGVRESWWTLEML